MNEAALIPDIGMLMSGGRIRPDPPAPASIVSSPALCPVRSRAYDNRPAAPAQPAGGFVLHGKLSLACDKTENRHADFQIPPPFECAVILIRTSAEASPVYHTGSQTATD